MEGRAGSDRGGAPWRRTLAVLAAGCLGAGLLVAAPAAQAQTPQARAAALTVRVQQLQEQAEAATEAYDLAASQLAQVVTAAGTAREHAEAAQAAQVLTAGVADTAIRRIYEAGGSGTILAGVLLAGGDPDSVATRLIAVDNQLAIDRTAAGAATASNQAALASQRRALALTDGQTVLTAQVAARAQAVTAALAQGRQLLAGATAQVRALEAADAARAVAAEAAAFRNALLASGDPIGSSALGPGDQAASSPAAGAALTAAENLSGHPYVWGGTGPVGYDCSGMTGAAYSAAGIALPRTAAQQYLSGPHVALADLLPGDLLFWATNTADPATIHHVAIYAGNGLMVSADQTGDVVRLQPVWMQGYIGATRPLVPAAAA